MDKIEIINLAPKFLTFYQKAIAEGASEERRWELWKENYHFAAVPPGDEGLKRARHLLNEVWEQYKEHLSYIENWKPDLQKVEAYLIKVKETLGWSEPINFVVIYYVGGFEDNPFVAPFDERLALCLPIEYGHSDITLAHELTHIVHAKTANLTGEWERSIATTVISEGLATQLSKYIVPGAPDEEYIEHKEGWFKSCKAMKLEMIKGILPYLDDSSSDSVFKFIVGNGTTNHEREAYYAGWEFVEFLLNKGLSFKDIASIQDKDIPEWIRSYYGQFVEELQNSSVI